MTCSTKMSEKTITRIQIWKMNQEIFRNYCIAKSGVTEEFPFGEETLVFKLRGKMFALTGISEIPGSCNLKCDPEKAEELRERFSAITPGYHMNKKHWNTVNWDGSISDQLIFELVDHSYDLIKASLPKNSREELSNISSPIKSTKKGDRKR